MCGLLPFLLASTRLGKISVLYGFNALNGLLPFLLWKEATNKISDLTVVSTP